jgi:hypothetical protein
MRELTKHRIKTFFIGLGAFLFALLFIPSPLCLIPRFCFGGLAISLAYAPEIYLNIPGYLSVIFLGTWLLFFGGGIIIMIGQVFRPERYEQRYCEHCQTETEQFLSKTNYKKGYKFQMSKPAENKANRESEEYTCEKCRKKNIVKVLGQGVTAKA